MGSLLLDDRLCELSQDGDCELFRIEGRREPTFVFNEGIALGDALLRPGAARLEDAAGRWLEREGFPLIEPTFDESGTETETLGVEICDDLFSEARGDGDGSRFPEDATPFRAAGDGDAGRLVTLPVVVRGEAPAVTRDEGDAARGADFTEGDAGRADDFAAGDAERGADFIEGDGGRGDTLTEVAEGLGKDFTTVSGNGTITPEDLGFSTFGTARGEEEGDGRGDTFSDVRAGLAEVLVDVEEDETATVDDLGSSTPVLARGETLVTPLSTPPDLGLAGDVPLSPFALESPF